jgi:hypothetical protein
MSQQKDNPLIRKPKFIGEALVGSIVGCALKDGDGKRLIVVELEILLRKETWPFFPTFLSNAMSAGTDVRQIVIGSDAVDVGLSGSREVDGGDVHRVERGRLGAGMRVKYGGLRGDEPCVVVRFGTTYQSGHLKWFADHLQGSILALNFFDLESEQKTLPIGEPETKAPTSEKKPRPPRPPRPPRAPKPEPKSEPKETQQVPPKESKPPRRKTKKGVQTDAV